MDVEMLRQIFNELLDIYEKKNHDYGDSVEDTYRKYGLVSFLVRMEDKLNRLRTLSQKEAEVVDEKIEDTLLDLANYAAIACMMLRKYHGNKYYSEALSEWFATHNSTGSTDSGTIIPYEIQAMASMGGINEW